ncbi:class I glutamine amidotransferase-like protein [Chaetomium strumarium]|uniref:Class I glutamine amidotransferase-like protein n=1 Tax=Chaetomium strumarium TaxID=1170767 RepID=A0AAJ0H127_9PEZI|nr:class I glutamine amidotransferase-like protein [Chaetomium strumarium]
MAAATESRDTIRIGVFIPFGCQLLDMACVDVFGTMSYEYLSVVSELVPAPILELTPSVKIFYISTVQPGSLIELTSTAQLACTHHLSDPAVQPGQLDIVIVPGPDPSLDWTTQEKKEALDWLAAHAAQVEKTDILSVCTGIYPCGAAGLLKGKKACGPRGLQADLTKKYEGVDWVGHELRWVRDGNFWSSGGVTNGNDLAAAYARESGRFPGPVAELALLMVDVGDRPQRYTTGLGKKTA